MGSLPLSASHLKRIPLLFASYYLLKYAYFTFKRISAVKLLQSEKLQWYLKPLSPVLTRINWRINPSKNHWIIYLYVRDKFNSLLYLAFCSTGQWFNLQGQLLVMPKACWSFTFTIFKNNTCRTLLPLLIFWVFFGTASLQWFCYSPFSLLIIVSVSRPCVSSQFFG
jgi:hypothetical protein